MSNLKIGFIGAMGSGKSELSEYFIKKFGGERISFATQLKKDITDYQWTPDGKILKSRDRKLLQNYGQFRRGELKAFALVEPLHVNNMEYPISYNKTLSFHNIDNYAISKHYTDTRVEINQLGKCYPTYWVDKAMEKALELSKTNNVIMDDIRRINESEALKENGFTIIKVWASDDTRKQRLTERDGSYNESDLHDISETEINDIYCDAILNNDKNNDNGKKYLDEIIKSIL